MCAWRVQRDSWQSTGDAVAIKCDDGADVMALYVREQVEGNVPRVPHIFGPILHNRHGDGPSHNHRCTHSDVALDQWHWPRNTGMDGHGLGNGRIARASIGAKRRAALSAAAT